MYEKGLPERDVLLRLRARLRCEPTYRSGRILGSMCTRPHALATRVYTLYTEKNLGDPSLFPETALLEREAVYMMGKLLSNNQPSGYIVSGGTEANILALWAARNLAKGSRRDVIAPTSAHFSIDKAADLLGLRLIKVGLNEAFQVDVDAVREAVTERTLAIVGVAGTTELGVVDPIRALSEIALAHNLYLHVDAAFGGFVLPFLKELGFNVPDFDFGLPGVSSITIDPHKMGLAPIPSGGILFRDASLTETIGVQPPYMGIGTKQVTLAGTRPGATVASVWALLIHMGKEGYRGVVQRCMRVTLNLVQGLRRITGVRLVVEPTMNIVGIKSETMPIHEVAEGLALRGWFISLFPNHIRIIVMPHVGSHHTQAFLEDLERVVGKPA